jgi:hypothetical protein
MRKPARLGQVRRERDYQPLPHLVAAAEPQLADRLHLLGQHLLQAADAVRQLHLIPLDLPTPPLGQAVDVPTVPALQAQVQLRFSSGCSRRR